MIWKISKRLACDVLQDKAPKRKVKAKLREGRSDPGHRKGVWAMDFIHDQLYDERKIRMINAIDAFPRNVPAIDVRRTYTGADMVDTLECARSELGYPKSIWVDQGLKCISKDLDLWAYTRSDELNFSRSELPTDHVMIERLNGRFRAECLNAHWSMNLADAYQKCESGREYYNNHRPISISGSSIGAA